MNVLVIGAPQSFGPNAGMASVDLAARSFFARRLSGLAPRFGALYPGPGDQEEPEAATIALADHPQAVDDPDLLLFWGDFHHQERYFHNAVARVAAYARLPLEEARRRVRRVLFLSERRGVEKPWMMFGETLLLNPAERFADPCYDADLRRVFREAAAVWVRDPFSALTVASLRDDFATSFVGVDPALLLGPETLAADRRPADRRGLGFYFGRSELPAPALRGLVEALAARLALEPEWIDWGGAPFFHDRAAEFGASTTGRSAAPSPIDGWERIARARGHELVVSDTYHLCVNAWAAGVPAVCVIDAPERAAHVNAGERGFWRDKRTVFYWMFDAQAFLVHGPELGSAADLAWRADLLAARLADGTAGAVADRMRRHAAAAEDGLVAAIAALG